jgi:Ca2+/H+ antiporter
VLAVFAVTFASLDGESNWFEGILLLALYLIVAIATYFVPASTIAATAGAH